MSSRRPTFIFLSFAQSRVGQKGKTTDPTKDPLLPSRAGLWRSMCEIGRNSMSTQNSPLVTGTFSSGLPHRTRTHSSSHIQPTKNGQPRWVKRKGKTSEKGEERDAWGPLRKWRNISSCSWISLSGTAGWLFGTHMQMRCQLCEDGTLRNVYQYTLSASSLMDMRLPASGPPQQPSLARKSSSESDAWIRTPSNHCSCRNSKFPPRLHKHESKLRNQMGIF